MTIGTGERRSRLHAVLKHCGQEEIGPSDVFDQSKDEMTAALLPPPDSNGYSVFAEFMLFAPARSSAKSAGLLRNTKAQSFGKHCQFMHFFREKVNSDTS